MFCNQCGSQLKEGAVFCTNCGAKQTGNEIPVQQPMQPVAPVAPAPAQNFADPEKTVGIFSEVPVSQPVQPAVSAEQPVAAPAQQPVAPAPAQNFADPEKTVGIFSEVPVSQPVQPAVSAEQPVAAPVQQPVAPVPAQNFADPEKTVGIFSEVPVSQPVQPAVSAEQPVAAPVQQPAYQVHTQPAYQAPIQPNNTYNENSGNVHNGKVSFFKAIALLFKNYFNFKGRASKSEYWWAFLFNTIASVFVYFLSYAVPPLGGLCSIALTIPQISLSVRRLHDIGKSGAFYFMGLIPFAGAIILLIQFFKNSDGDNKWGPGPKSVQGATEYVNSTVTNTAPVQKSITDNDIYVMAQNHEPVNLGTPEAKFMMDSALNKIIPTYTGAENLVGSMMLCDPQVIKSSIASTDTDTLIVIFKALGYHIGQGEDANILGMVQQNVLSTLKTRF